MSKNNKIIIAVVAIVAVVAGVFFVGQSGSDTGKEVRVVVEQKSDKSFGESAANGCEDINEQYASEGYNCEVIEAGAGAPDAVTTVTSAAEEADLVIAVGFTFADAIHEVAATYPDKQFAIVDDNTYVGDPNVVNVMFKENEGAYMAGAVAATKAQQMGVDQIGFIGGMDVPVIARFETGFLAGVNSVDPAMAESMDIQFAQSFTDAAIGNSLGTDMYNSGDAIIFHAAGGVGTGLFTAAETANANGEEKYVIGVDSAQCANDPGNGAEYCLTSVIKGVDIAVMNVFTSWKDGNFGSEMAGQQVTYGVADGAIDLEVTPTMENDPELMAAYETAKAGILDGSIVVPGADAMSHNDAMAMYKG